MRPLLPIDETRELLLPVFDALRPPTSAGFDWRAILSLVLAGDNRLLDRFRRPD